MHRAVEGQPEIALLAAERAGDIRNRALMPAAGSAVPVADERRARLRIGAGPEHARYGAAAGVDGEFARRPHRRAAPFRAIRACCRSRSCACILNSSGRPECPSCPPFRVKNAASGPTGRGRGERFRDTAIRASRAHRGHTRGHRRLCRRVWKPPASTSCGFRTRRCSRGAGAMSICIWGPPPAPRAGCASAPASPIR